MSEDKKQNKKVVLISGGMGGVGSAAAALLISRGYRVAVLYHHSPEAAVEEKQKEQGVDSFFIPCDVTDTESVRRAVECVLDHFGAIDIGVHAAVGPITRKPVLDMSEGEFRGAFETSLFGAFNLFSALAPEMQKRRSGMLIGITSAALEEGGGGARMAAYTTAKAALRGLLRALHHEQKAHGIKVYAVAPALLRTALTADLPDKYFEYAAAAAPGQKLQTPEDVAEAVLSVCEGRVPPGSSVLVESGEAAPL